MTENVNFLDSATDNWNEANWHKVAKLLNGIDGVLRTNGSALAVIQATPAAMSVIVGTGMSWFNGIEYDNTVAKTLVIGAAHASYNRYDYIVVEADFTGNTCVAKVVPGTAAASPTAPTLTQTDGVLWQFPLALVLVPAAATSILTADITDVRKMLFGTTIPYVLDGGTLAITTGSKGIIPRLPFSCTITGWTLIADQTGSIVIDVKKSTYAAFPTTTSIVAAAKPTLSSAQKATSTTLTGWTVALLEGDVLEFYVDSCTTITRATLTLDVTG